MLQRQQLDYGVFVVDLVSSYKMIIIDTCMSIFFKFIWALSANREISMVLMIIEYTYLFKGQR